MPKSAVKSPAFDQYKPIKDEIIDICEMRFELFLDKKLDQFRRDFKKDLMDELSPRFNAIDARFDAVYSRFDANDSKFGAVDSKFVSFNSRFDSIDSKFETLKWSIWSLPIIMTVIMALFTLLLKHVII